MTEQTESMENRVTLYLSIYLLSAGHHLNAQTGLYSLLVSGVMKTGHTVDVSEAGGKLVVTVFWAACKWQHWSSVYLKD